MILTRDDENRGGVGDGARDGAGDGADDPSTGIFQMKVATWRDSACEYDFSS